LEAERIEWMAPALENIGIGTSNMANNEPPYPNSFPGHIAFYKEVTKKGIIIVGMFHIFSDWSHQFDG
jgi:hypothetical protein